ncbi:flagellar basal-body rod protein FlgF [Collimonas sp. OK607]|uniref:flagellar basal body rod protein FlgF n=1 Tax=Collimonas sp. OK607 TaxID=1798194 RepID=UPI0008EB1F20|nr:flagellar basal body rod protein FlgF [Collimonas sp. OK607]SFB22229.1 flagellar basal-body rod protein FlgF [Collimonas sp. OK607]
MDRMIYIAMSGAKQVMEQQASAANNMANVSTPGFRAQLNNFRAVPVVGQEAATRAFVVTSTPGADMSNGPVTETGRPMDVAVRGDGWLAVQTADGGEAYTRVGNLQVGADGQLMTMSKLPVIGDAGPMAVPPGAAVMISADGLVSAIGAGDPATNVAQVGRLKLVNPAAADLQRGDDGLFRMRAGAATPDTDPTVTLQTGAIEGSNVNPVSAMVDMIANARSFEMQMKAVKSADENDQRANQLLSMST